MRHFAPPLTPAPASTDAPSLALLAALDVEELARKGFLAEFLAESDIPVVGISVGTRDHLSAHCMTPPLRSLHHHVHGLPSGTSVGIQ